MTVSVNIPATTAGQKEILAAATRQRTPVDALRRQEFNRVLAYLNAAPLAPQEMQILCAAIERRLRTN